MQQIVLKIAKGTFYLLVGSIIIAIINFVFKYLIAIYLGPTDLGIISLLLMIIGIFTVFFSFGIPGSIIKFIAEYNGKAQNPILIINICFKLIFIGAIFGALVLFFLSGNLADLFKSSNSEYAFQIGSIILFSTIIGKFLESGLMGFHKMELSTIMEISNYSLLLIISIIALFFGFGINGAFFGMLLGALSMTLLGYKYLSKIIILSPLETLNNSIVHKIFHLSIPFYFSLIIEMCIGWTDLFFIGIILGAAYAGVYSVGILIIGIIMAIIRPINQTLFPIFSELFGQNAKDTLKKLLYYNLKYTLLISIPIAITLIFNAETIIYTLFGEEYTGAVIPLQILSIGAIFSSLKAMTTKIIVAMGESAFILRISVLTIVFYAISISILIHLFGLAGAALSFTISLIFHDGFIFYRIFKEYDIDLKFLKYFIISNSILVGYFIVCTNFITIGSSIILLALEIIIGILIYFITLVITKAFSDEERSIFSNLFNWICNQLFQNTLKI